MPKPSESEDEEDDDEEEEEEEEEEEVDDDDDGMLILRIKFIIVEITVPLKSNLPPLILFLERRGSHLSIQESHISYTRILNLKPLATPPTKSETPPVFLPVLSNGAFMCWLPL